MKSTFITFLFSLSAGIVMLGCKKHNTTIPIIPVGFYAVTNDSQFIAQYYVAHRDSFSSSGISLEIDGADTFLYKEIHFSIPNFKNNTGTYTLGHDWTYPSKNVARYIYFNSNLNATNTFFSASGTITIYKVSADNIQGAFNFITDSGLIIKNGTFNLEFD